MSCLSNYFNFKTSISDCSKLEESHDLLSNIATTASIFNNSPLYGNLHALSLSMFGLHDFEYDNQ